MVKIKGFNVKKVVFGGYHNSIAVHQVSRSTHADFAGIAISIDDLKIAQGNQVK